MRIEVFRTAMILLPNTTRMQRIIKTGTDRNEFPTSKRAEISHSVYLPRPSQLKHVPIHPVPSRYPGQ